MANLLNSEQIEAAIKDLPLQGRIMLHLLLLQYFDIGSDEVEYIAADRPDPRIVAGAKPTAPVISRETLNGIAKRVAHYRTQLRQRRERAWWRIECLRKLISLDQNLITLAERLLTSRFGVTPETLSDLEKQARTAVHRPLLRDLDRRWVADEISEDDYRKGRLQMELQSIIRRLEREQRRLEVAQRDFEMASTAAHQDHEVAHMWGIPNGTLAARKVKYLHQYLEALQKRLAASRPPGQETALAPVDLWRETYRTLALMPVDRTVAAYDGLEGSEEELLDKLAIFAAGKMAEDQETKFWASLIQEFRHRAEYGSTPYSLFGLQRLSAMLEETDTSSDALEHDLIARISPAPKATDASLDESGKPKPELGQIGEHVVRMMFGEDR